MAEVLSAILYGVRIRNIGGACRSKVPIKLQKQFTTPQDAAEYFHRLEKPQPLEPSPYQSATQFSETYPTLQQPSQQHTLPSPCSNNSQSLTVQLPEAQQMQTPSNPSATQHSICLSFPSSDATHCNSRGSIGASAGKVCRGFQDPFSDLTFPAFTG